MGCLDAVPRLWTCLGGAINWVIDPPCFGAMAIRMTLMLGGDRQTSWMQIYIRKYMDNMPKSIARIAGVASETQ